MKITKIATIKGGQDGAIYGTELFRFDEKGNCSVYDLQNALNGEVVNLTETATFTLDRANELAPHSNCVCFSNEFYEKGDEYPLLYSNIYNNYAGNEDSLLGVCLVYRLQRLNGAFKTTLMQMVEIGFCEDPELWKATKDEHGVRPFGNFVIYKQTSSYYAFVMRNKELGTRFFKFDLPSVHSGEYNAKYKVKKVTLTKSDIKESFDCSFFNYVQGAILDGNNVYSTEGFTNDNINRPALRLIDPVAKKHKAVYYFSDFGTTIEPELIDFDGDDCYYADNEGNVYKLTF